MAIARLELGPAIFLFFCEQDLVIDILTIGCSSMKGE